MEKINCNLKLKIRSFAADLPLCPCTLQQALHDKGRYRPDFECDRDSNPTCLRHKGAIHCVVSGTPTLVFLHFDHSFN